MVKTGPNFKLSKTSKRILALGKWKNAEQRNGWKRMMIEAEYFASLAPRPTKKERTPE